jgi:hypothetical protein
MLFIEMGKQSQYMKQILGQLNTIKQKGISAEQERFELSGKVVGFLNAMYGESRGKRYKQFISIDVDHDHYTEKEFQKKTALMVDYIGTLAAEVDAKEMFKGENGETFEELEKDVEKHMKESERRKNVAEFKYWGFAIELIDTVRQELKKNRELQEELIKETRELRKELIEFKDNNHKEKGQ